MLDLDALEHAARAAQAEHEWYYQEEAARFQFAALANPAAVLALVAEVRLLREAATSARALLRVLDRETGLGSGMLAIVLHQLSAALSGEEPACGD